MSATLVLEKIRETHDTTTMGEQFTHLVDAVLFYLKGGFNVDQTAKMVVEEFWFPDGSPSWTK